MANGLFMNPQQVMAAEQQLRQQQAIQAGATPLGAAGQELGRSLAGAFGSALGAPMQDSPEVQLARIRTQAVQGLDPTNRDSYKKAAQQLYSSGDFAGATQLLGQMPAVEQEKLYTLGKDARLVTAAGEERARGLPSTEASKAPTMRTIRQGKEMVNQEWNPQAKQWVEVGRGPVGGGMEVNISNAPDNWTKIFDRYEKQMKPIEEERAQVARIKTAINTPGGASNQALQTSIANLFGGQTRAIAELERWATFGNLPDRVINSASRFLSGEYTEGAKADVLRLLRNYEATGLNKKHESINERMRKPAEALKISPNMYETDIPEVRMIDFSQMSLEDIANIDPTTLELDERKDLEDRLTELGY